MHTKDRGKKDTGDKNTTRKRGKNNTKEDDLHHTDDSGKHDRHPEGAIVKGTRAKEDTEAGPSRRITKEEEEKRRHPKSTDSTGTVHRGDTKKAKEQQEDRITGTPRTSGDRHPEDTDSGASHQGKDGRGQDTGAQGQGEGQDRKERSRPEEGQDGKKGHQEAEQGHTQKVTGDHGLTDQGAKHRPKGNENASNTDKATAQQDAHRGRNGSGDTEEATKKETEEPGRGRGRRRAGGGGQM